MSDHPYLSDDDRTLSRVRWTEYDVLMNENGVNPFAEEEIGDLRDEPEPTKVEAASTLYRSFAILVVLSSIWLPFAVWLFLAKSGK